MKPTMIKIAKRMKNPKVAVAVVSGMLLVLVNSGIITAELSEQFMTNFNILLGIGITLGIFANPDSHIKDEE